MWAAIKKLLGFATLPENAVRESFQREHPEEQVAWTQLAADEEDRFVVGVFYGNTRPPRYVFFTLNKTTGDIAPIDDDTAYRPAVWH